jgi:hypothetical protein
VFFSFAFRLPALVNAAATNSDAAIVGLQAMHILRGEWSLFLLGSGYQTSVDSFVAAAFFVVLGATPFALMLSALALHVAATVLAYATLGRHLPKWTAVIASAALVFTGSTIHGYALYPPRQAALTLVFVAVWTIDGARGRRELARFAAGGAIASLACFADPYALLFTPLLALHAVLAACDGAPPLGLRARRVGAAVAGSMIGGLPIYALVKSSRSQHGEATLTTHALDHNLRLLVDECLPWAMSTKVYVAQHMMDYAPWTPPRPFVWFQLTAAVIVTVLVATGGALFFLRRIPWEVRRLGLVGFASVPVTIGGFLASVMVMDHFSARYLAAMLLMVPFALAPFAYLAPRRSLAVAIAPWLVSAGVAGWVGYAPFVDGLAIRTDYPGTFHDDERLGEMLRARGVHVAVADYWTSYRLSFLYREDPLVVPSHDAQDRYAPHRQQVERATRYAYIVDPLRSDESVEAVEARLRTNGQAFERIRAGGAIALVVTVGDGSRALLR